MESRPRIHLHNFGDEAVPVVVIDGFARDPNQWRKASETADYQPLGDFYPGRRAAVPKAYFDDIGPLLGSIFRNAFGCTKNMSVDRALYSIVSTPASELNIAQRIPHIDDTGPDRFAMVHYLSHGNFGGTGFYRHRTSGFETITAERHRAYLDLLDQDFAANGVPEPGYINGNTALFEQTGIIEHAYNRAVIYPGNLLHCSMTADVRHLPDNPLSGRLTVAAFLLAR